MSNPNPPSNPNPNIAEEGKATRFNSETGKKAGQKAWSIRHSLRYMAAQNIDPNDPDALKKLLGKQTTVAQLAAMRLLQRATSENADTKAIETAMENIDGKLVQPTLNADLAAIQNMSEDELRDYVKQLESAAGESFGAAGTEETPGPEATNPGDAEGSGPKASA